jgi:hypothetical protein
MFTYYDWHLIRALAFLAVLGVFILYASLIGILQHRKATQTRTLEEARPAAPALAGLGSHRVFGQPVRRESRSLAQGARQAA